MKKLFSLLLIGLCLSIQAQGLENFCGDNIFDLNEMNYQRFNAPSTTQIRYFETQSDANANTNVIINSNVYPATSASQTIYARLNNLGNIYVDSFTINVNPNMLGAVMIPVSNAAEFYAYFMDAGQQPYTYQWYFNGMLLAGQTQITINFLNYPPGMFSVTATDANGCTGTASRQSEGAVSTNLIANDNTYELSNLGIGPPGLGSVLGNDMLNGLPATLNQVAITVVSTTNENIGLNPQGFIYANTQTPSGTYTLVYQICEIANPNNCDMASVTVTVDYCRAATPIIESLNMPTCENISGATVHLTGLPEAGTWHMEVTSLSGNGITTYDDVGAGFVLSGLDVDTYSVTVLAQDMLMGNCYESFPVIFTVDTAFGLASEMTGTYEDFNANGIVDVGDIINYGFSIVNSACVPAVDVYLSSTTINVSGETINSLAGNTTDTSFSGIYALTQNDINAGQVTHSITIQGYYGEQFLNIDNSFTLALNISDGIKLNAFLDSNNNGVQDGDEENFTEGYFNCQLNLGTTHQLISSTGTYYLYETNQLNLYNIGYVLNPTTSCQSNYLLTTASYNNVAVAHNSGVVTYNFPITVASSCTDLSIHLLNVAMTPRPGFVYQNQIYYTNHSNEPQSGRVTFKKDSVLTITGTSESGAAITPDGFTFDFTDLPPHYTKAITVMLQVPTIPTIALGTFLTNTASITLLPDDIYELNNADTLSQLVVGSFDPNEKTENHGGKIVFSDFSADDYLTYTIRFENTGTAEAINIRVEDILDDQLDETSIRMLRASHPYVLDRVGNVLNWKFNGVNLPPSVDGDDVTGHGYIAFQVKPKPGFVLGDEIPNTASIYFDFNPAIVTDPCVTEFVTALASDTFAFDHFRAYPNPVKNIFYISNASAMDKLVLTSITGQTIMDKSINAVETEIDLTLLSKGIYFAKVISQNQEKTIKVIKE